MAIPNYLEKHFKEKAKLKKERAMMGDVKDELQAKIDEMEGENTANRKMIDVGKVKRARQKAMEEESYI